MKFAVVALSESIAHDLKDAPIGVSVLAPAAVKTRIYTSGENRPARFGGPYEEPGNNPFQSELDEGWSRTWWASAWCARSAIVSSMCSPTCTPGLAFGAPPADHRGVRRMREVDRRACRAAAVIRLSAARGRNP
jgi:NAD(P)-dependent dehydrogenase (short-subunit alcohol dehydrogenase family)